MTNIVQKRNCSNKMVYYMNLKSQNCLYLDCVYWAIFFLVYFFRNFKVRTAGYFRSRAMT